MTDEEVTENARFGKFYYADNGGAGVCYYPGTEHTAVSPATAVLQTEPAAEFACLHLITPAADNSDGCFEGLFFLKFELRLKIGAPFQIFVNGVLLVCIKSDEIGS